jgi:hypothetical protein
VCGFLARTNFLLDRSIVVCCVFILADWHVIVLGIDVLCTADWEWGVGLMWLDCNCLNVSF